MDMKSLSVALFIIAAAASTYGAEWYDNLPPGIRGQEECFRYYPSVGTLCRAE
ncbi:MAG: hypothetical protein JXA73_08365 [Acidobacteria bacterium]|nr:hypothetical protein [Acidobacteriota bacterium]